MDIIVYSALAIFTVFLIFGLPYLIYCLQQMWKINKVRAMVCNGINNGNILLLEVETDEGIHYAYNLVDECFMAQGNSLKELFENLSRQYPDKTIHVVGLDEKEEAERG